MKAIPDSNRALLDHAGEIVSTLLSNGHFPYAIALTSGEMVTCSPAFSDILMEAGLAEDSQILPDTISGYQIVRLPLHEEQTVLVLASRIPMRSGFAGIREIYRSLVDTGFEMVFRTNHEFEVTFCNSLFRSLLEWPVGQKTTPLLQYFSNTEQLTDIISRIGKEERIHGEIVHLRTLSGKELIGMANVTLLKKETGKQYLHWNILDISEQHQYEESLRQKNEQLAKLNRQMERFMYSTSHDLRSPLTSILGLVNLINIETKDHVVQSYASKIEASALRLDKIIRNIISFAKTTYQRINSAPVDFESIIWRSIHQHQVDAESRSIQFEVNVPQGHVFYSDPERVEIILDNIIRNCFTFIDPNKVKPFVRINVRIETERAVLEIVDNGVGIGKTHLPNIFNMFYKASTESRGAGLGLFIVKEGLEILKGSIEVESEFGFGTMFRVTIPNDPKGKLISRKLKLANQRANPELFD